MPHNELSALCVVSFNIYNNPRNPSPLPSPCTAADTWCLDSVWVAQGWQIRREPEFKPTQSNSGGLLTTTPSISQHILLLCQVVNSLREKNRDKDIFTLLHITQNIYFFKNFVLNVWMNETSPPYILSISLTLLKRKCIQLYLISFLIIYKIWKGLKWHECQ